MSNNSRIVSISGNPVSGKSTVVNKIIEKLKGFSKENRKIRFTTAIALSDGKDTICEIGTIDGFVSEEVRGENGFGFDEIFELENGKTLAELTQEEKNEISARKIALEKIRKKFD